MPPFPARTSAPPRLAADSEFEIANAARPVLERNPFANADQLRVGAKKPRRRPDGVVPTDLSFEPD